MYEVYHFRKYGKIAWHSIVVVS